MTRSAQSITMSGNCSGGDHRFPEGGSFEDVIRTAVSLGGDCDTLTCIVGSVAKGFYGVPEELKQQCQKRLPTELLSISERYESHICAKKQ